MDISYLLKFYASPLGISVQKRLTPLIYDIWPALKGDTFVCHGFPFPFFEKMNIYTNRKIVFMNPQIGVINYPESGKNITALVNEDEFPLQDGSVDHLLLIHSFEYSQTPKKFLREIWRILAPEGRAIIIVPNRRSLWSQFDHTPLGHGKPYSMGQLSQLLKESQFSICQKKRCLYIMPSEFWNRVITSPMMEAFNKTFAHKLSGIIAIEFKKQVYCGSLPKERKRLLITPSPIRAKLSSLDDIG